MRYLVLLVALVLGAGFVFLNWNALLLPVDVNMLFTTAKAPLGMMILVWFGILFFIVAYGMVSQQVTALTTARKLSKELEEQRKLATNAEASRLSDVKSEVDKKFQTLVEENQKALAEAEKRIIDGQSAIMESFKSTLKDAEQSNEDLSKSVTSALDTMDDKITKVLISATAIANRAEGRAPEQLPAP